MRIEAHDGHGTVGHGGLPAADHLVAVGQAAHAAVADVDEEVFRGYGGQLQHAVGGFLQIDMAT